MYTYHKNSRKQIRIQSPVTLSYWLLQLMCCKLQPFKHYWLLSQYCREPVLLGVYSRTIHINKLGSIHSIVENLSYYAPPLRPEGLRRCPNRSNHGGCISIFVPFFVIICWVCIPIRKINVSKKDSLTVL